MAGVLVFPKTIELHSIDSEYNNTNIIIILMRVVNNNKKTSMYYTVPHADKPTYA